MISTDYIFSETSDAEKIAGGVIGGLVGLALTVLVIVLVVRKWVNSPFSPFSYLLGFFLNLKNICYEILKRD